MFPIVQRAVLAADSLLNSRIAKSGKLANPQQNSWKLNRMINSAACAASTSKQASKQVFHFSDRGNVFLEGYRQRRGSRPEGTAAIQNDSKRKAQAGRQQTGNGKAYNPAEAHAPDQRKSLRETIDHTEEITTMQTNPPVA